MIVKSRINRIKSRLSVLVILIAVCFLFTTNASAQGDLLIFPKRVVFEGSKRVQQIILSNVGKDTAVYNISFRQYKMTDSGEFKTITEPDSGQHFASPYLRVYPRRVILAPNESQTVKVQVKNTNIESGEYRSHLYFRAENNTQPLGQDNTVADSTDVSVKLKAVFGITIATIIKKGTSNTVSSISDLSYEKNIRDGYFINFSINRQGNYSTYGDIRILYISSDNSSYEVGKASGLAVYAPGNVRKVKMQLQKPEDISFSDGKFKIIYTENGTEKIIAEAEQEI